MDSPVSMRLEPPSYLLDPPVRPGEYVVFFRWKSCAAFSGTGFHSCSMVTLRNCLIKWGLRVRLMEIPLIVCRQMQTQCIVRYHMYDVFFTFPTHQQLKSDRIHMICPKCFLIIFFHELWMMFSHWVVVVFCYIYSKHQKLFLAQTCSDSIVGWPSLSDFVVEGWKSTFCYSSRM